MQRPDLTRVPDYFHRYINQVKSNDLISALNEQQEAFSHFLEKLPEEKRDFFYAPGKWTIREMIQHLLDAERVFAYRALSFSRKDPNPLPGFEEDDWVIHSGGSTRNWEDLLEEFKSVRRSTTLLFSSFNNEQMESAGTTSGKQIYVLSIGYIIAGHIEHHMKVIKERYL